MNEHIAWKYLSDLEKAQLKYVLKIEEDSDEEVETEGEREK